MSRIQRYWELIATIDHYLPVTRGGVDAPPNWMTTSQARNSAKLNWTVDELGWKDSMTPETWRRGTGCSTGVSTTARAIQSTSPMKGSGSGSGRDRRL